MGRNDVQCLEAILKAFKNLPKKRSLHFLDFSRAFKGYAALRRFARYQSQGNFDSASGIRRKPVNPFE
jgi:hypothetical protein